MSTPNLWLCYGVTSPLPPHTNISLIGADTNSHSGLGCFSHLRSFLRTLAASENWLYLVREVISKCLNI